MSRPSTPTRFTTRPPRTIDQSVTANDQLRNETPSIGNRFRNIPIQVYEEGAVIDRSKFRVPSRTSSKIHINLLSESDNDKPIKDIDFDETDFIVAMGTHPEIYRSFFYRSPEIAVDRISYIDFDSHSQKIKYNNLRNRIIKNRFTPEQMEIVKNAIQELKDKFDNNIFNLEGYEDVYTTLAANKDRMLEYISLNNILYLLNCKTRRSSGCAIMGGKRKTRKQLKKTSKKPMKKSRKKYRKRKTKKYMKNSNKN